MILVLPRVVRPAEFFTIETTELNMFIGNIIRCGFLYHLLLNSVHCSETSD